VISVLCPSRERPELLKRSVESLRDTARSSFELLVAADHDDRATASAADGMGALVLVMERAGYDRLHEYYAALAEMSTGDWLLVWNDDAVMQTPGWDQIIENVPPEVLIANLGTTHSPLCCLPAVRRSAVDALGRFSTANPHCDTFWQDVGSLTGTIAPVPVFASLDSAIKAGQTHGFYEPGHQAEVYAAAAVIRQMFP
jgi:hypothetical protein